MESKTLTPSKVKYDNARRMMGVQYYGKDDVRVVQLPVPMVTDATDAVVKVTATTICGSDLHLYHGEIPSVKRGDILGHESVGIVEDVGSQVKTIKKGDRVVISAVIGCGMCDYCKRGEWSCCDVTNQSKEQEALYGNHTGALFGYTDMFGGYDGCQAEFVRVPFADVNLFKIPAKISDAQALLIADIACTGYHGTELSHISNGDKVVIFGCGPVGLMAAMWAKHRGAIEIASIDIDEQRLKFAKDRFGVVPINSKEVDPVKAVQELMPGGPDKVIDCVGFRFPESFLDKVERKIGLETDSPNIVNAAIKMVRKNGHITLIGDYAGYTNHFNIGAFMEKHLTMNGGQLWPQSYKDKIFQAMESGAVDPTVVITHQFPLSKCADVYKMFDKHEGGMIKALIIPDDLYASVKSTGMGGMKTTSTTATAH